MSGRTLRDGGHGIRSKTAAVSLLGWILFPTVAVTGSALAAHLIRSQSTYVEAHPQDVSWYPSLKGTTLSRKQWFELVEDSHTNLESRDPQILVIGDSITYLSLAFHRDIWNEFYGEGKTLNLGIPGDWTQHVLWRFYRYPLTPLDPEVAVVLLGVNNLQVHSPAETAAGVAQVVKLIQKQLPGTEILIIGILPVGSGLGKVSRKARDTNRLLERWASQRDVAYVNLGEHFRSPDGSVRMELYADEVHLSEEGIRVWAEALRPVLRPLMSSPDSVMVNAASDLPESHIRRTNYPKPQVQGKKSGAGSGT